MTGTYVFQKLFEKATEDYEFEQRIWLTLGEFEHLVSSTTKIQNSVVDQQSSTKPLIAKKPKTQQEVNNGCWSDFWAFSKILKTISETVQSSHCGRET